MRKRSGGRGNYKASEGWRWHLGLGGCQGWGWAGGASARLPGFGGGRSGWSVLGFVVGVNAGLLLSVLVVCESRIFSLSLLATVRGGTSFLCPKRQRNEAKKTLSNRATLSVHSVQFLFIGAPKARCSPERRMFETLLLANPDMNTLRPVRSRASTSCQGIRTASRVLPAVFFDGFAARFMRPYSWITA